MQILVIFQVWKFASSLRLSNMGSPNADALIRSRDTVVDPWLVYSWQTKKAQKWVKVFRPGKRALVYRLLQLQLSLFVKYLYGEFKL